MIKPSDVLDFLAGRASDETLAAIGEDLESPDSQTRKTLEGLRQATAHMFKIDWEQIFKAGSHDPAIRPDKE